MKKFLVFISVFSMFSLKSQENPNPKLNGGLIFGKILSNFSFKDSENIKEENLDPILGNSYGANLLYRLNSKNSIRPELLFYNAGAKQVENDLVLEWRLNYIGLGAGYNYSLIKVGNTSLAVGTMIRADYLIRAEQTIGESRINLIEQKAFTKIDVNANFNASLSFKLSEYSNIFLEYRYAFGLNQIERDPINTEQKTRNKAHLALVGINFNL